MPLPVPPPTPDAALAEGYRIRDMLESDADRTAQLHREHLHLGLFPSLGHRFVARWHQTFVTSAHAWAAVVVAPDGAVVAMVLMTTDQHDYLTETLLHHRWPLARAGAVGLVRDPRVLAHFARTRALRYWRRFHRARRPVVALEDPAGRLGVVHAVVTDESARGLGCARALLHTAEDHARRRGTVVLALVTEHLEVEDAARPPRGAGSFYERSGWVRTDLRTRDGHRIAEYRRRLAPAAGPVSATDEAPA